MFTAPHVYLYTNRYRCGKCNVPKVSGNREFRKCELKKRSKTSINFLSFVLILNYTAQSNRKFTAGRQVATEKKTLNNFPVECGKRNLIF